MQKKLVYPWKSALLISLSLLVMMAALLMVMAGCSHSQPAGNSPPTHTGTDLSVQQNMHQDPCPAGEHRFTSPNTGAENCVKDGTNGAGDNHN